MNGKIMKNNELKLKTVSDLLGMNFFVPSYQRGYRWTAQQVEDLLNDIQEFIEKKQKGGFYCIQPLVVKEREQETFNWIKKEAKDLNEVKNRLKGSWEVIDGQQRLTTIHILLSYLESAGKYLIEYETRENSKSFLVSLDDKKKEDNIDYYHMIIAKKTIENWFNDKDSERKQYFFNTLLEKVKFIWYESVDENPIKVFIRLNIGKISLTNAELIKALFLNKSNFQGTQDEQKIHLQQQEIAGEWDKIEYTLQNDEFWMFLNKPEYDKPTRIDFIFDLICEKDVLNLQDEYKEQLGKDEYKTFRYFYFWFKENSSKIMECWKEVKTLFQIFQEWFNNLELYHYIGFMIEQGNRISEMVDEWRKNQTKDRFIKEYVILEIKKKLGSSDLYKQYEVNNNPKTQCRPILLLHNIQTVINQNDTLKNNEKYKLPVFYKFPFHLFKKEKWDVEHIDSHTENSLENENDQKEWLKLSYDFVMDDIKEKIDDWLKEHEKKKEKRDLSKYNFDELYQKIIMPFKDTDKLKDNKSVTKNGGTIIINEKDMLWNFTLLDSSTNRSYGNAIFPAKRREILNKKQGKNNSIAFIPPCTEKVFAKDYNPFVNSFKEWNKSDAEAYLENIKTTLEKFLK
jgi:hypothetical protein